MALMPKGSSKLTFATTLSPGALIMYENDGAPILGIVLQLRKSRYLVLNDRGRETELDAVRIHELPGRAPGALTTIEQKTSFLVDLLSSAKAHVTTIAMEELWSFVKDEPRDYSTEELSQLYFGDDSLTNHLTMRVALLAGGQYFKRQRDSFVPRTAAQVDELVLAEKAAAERKRREQITVAFFKQRTIDPATPLPEEAHETIRLLEDLSVANEQLDNNRQKEVKELLDQAATLLNLSPHGRAHDRAFAILREIHHFGPDENLSLLRHRPPVAFPVAVVDSARAAIDAFRALEPARVDLTAIACITIDDISTKDMDDALSLERRGSGFRLGIHISDVAAIVQPTQLVEREARRRATSIYLPERTIHMLPELLSEDQASLRAAEVRPVLSYLIDLNSDFSIVGYEIVPAIIKVTERLTYDRVDQLLEPSPGAPHDYLQADLSLSNLYHIAMSQQEFRISKGASMLQKKEIVPMLDDQGQVHFMEIDEESPGRALVAEMMVLANRLSAEFAASHNLPLIFRGQEAPDLEGEQERDEASSNDTTRGYAMRARLKRSVSSTTPMPHSTLGLAAYAQLTSPIRRYSDLCNQRQLSSFLRDGNGHYSASDFEKILEEIEEPLSRAAAVSKETKRYWLLKFLALRQKSDSRIGGIVVRTDLKNPLVELDEIHAPFFVKCEKLPELGSRIQVRIVSVHPHGDFIRLEQAQ